MKMVDTQKQSTQLSGGRIKGLLLCIGVSMGAHLLAHAPFAPFTWQGGHPIDPLALAILIGMGLRSIYPQMGIWGMCGFKYAIKVLLPLAIVFLGFKLNLFYIFELSGQSLGLSVSCVLIALFGTYWLCSRCGISQSLGLLIASGTAICGGTAIAVIAPVICSKDEESAFALSSVTLFGLICVLCFPFLGTLFNLSQYEFGVWSGIAVHATAQVIATAQSYGVEAGEVALVVKLTRVLLLAPILVGMRLIYASSSLPCFPSPSSFWSFKLIKTLFPPFMLGFLLCAGLNTYQILPNLIQIGPVDIVPSSLFKKMSYGLLLMGMSGVGLQVNLLQFRQIGWTPLLIGGGASLLIAGISLGGIWLFL